jgi:hypothetical protein
LGDFQAVRIRVLDGFLDLRDDDSIVPFETMPSTST